MTLRSFLFLQGATSPFFSRLGQALKRQGHTVHRINFNVGDRIYWWGNPAWNYRGNADAFKGYLEQCLTDCKATDLIALGDTRPLHKPAVTFARARGLRLHVVEEGYFRPNWLTFERDGINGYSRLPQDPAWYQEAARLVPDYGDGVSVHNPTALIAAHELAYHIPGLLNPLLYPGYQTHRPNVSPVEFWGWCRRFVQMPAYERRDQRAIADLLDGGRPFYLFPLQINGDSQIRYHSGSRGIPQIIKRVINSFFRHAPEHAMLVIKNHPLDTGLIDYPDWIARLERRLGVQGRILYLESGKLPALLQKARGLVTVNSSVGTSALINNCPVIALGKAIYAIPGLTFQAELDAFWQHGEKPDRSLLRSFRKTVIHTAQVNGGFYSRAGISLGVANCCARLATATDPLDELISAIGLDSNQGDS